MTTKTAFRPETDAFAFDNSWPIDGWELNGIRRYLAGEHNGVVRALANSGLAHLIVREVHERHLLDDVLTDEHLTAYGLCGGMAFAALDYYMQDWVVLQSTGPHDHPQHNQSAGLTASPTSGACVTLEYTARNDSFSRCPPLALRVRGRLLDDPTPTRAPVGEDERRPLAAGACRALAASIPHDGAAAARFSACCSLGVVDGVEVWKDILAHNPAIMDAVIVRPA